MVRYMQALHEGHCATRGSSVVLLANGMRMKIVGMLEGSLWEWQHFSANVCESNK